MRPSIKSALLSGILMPGFGQIYLKYYLRGTFYLLITLGCLFLLIKKTIHIFEILVETMMDNSRVVLDIQSLLFQVQKIMKNQNWLIYEIAAYLLLVCWIVSTIDAYYLGKKQEKAQQPPVEPPVKT